MPNVLGIDQSYSRLGIAVVDRYSLVAAESMNLTKLKNDTQKRLAAKELVKQWIEKYQPRLLVVERVRLFAGRYLSGNTAMRLASMTAYIVDVATCIGVYDGKAARFLQTPLPVFSVDTRSWKKIILGSSNAEKADAVNWVRETYGAVVNHDTADAICMAAYAFRKERKLTRER